VWKTRRKGISLSDIVSPVRPRRRLAPFLLLGILTLGAGLGVGLGLSEGPVTYSAQTQVLAETCNVFKSHYATKQVHEVATWGQESGDAELEPESAHLQVDLRGPRGQVSALIELVKITERCYQLGAIPKSDVTKDFANPSEGITQSTPFTFGASGAVPNTSNAFNECMAKAAIDIDTSNPSAFKRDAKRALAICEKGTAKARH
jgi:hypothetical protein